MREVWVSEAVVVAVEAYDNNPHLDRMLPETDGEFVVLGMLNVPARHGKLLRLLRIEPLVYCCCRQRAVEVVAYLENGTSTCFVD